MNEAFFQAKVDQLIDHGELILKSIDSERANSRDPAILAAYIKKLESVYRFGEIREGVAKLLTYYVRDAKKACTVIFLINANNGHEYALDCYLSYLRDWKANPPLNLVDPEGVLWD